MINISQVKGGKKLQETVEEISKSYSSDKVATNITRNVYKRAEDGEKQDEEGYALDEHGERIVEKVENITLSEALEDINNKFENMNNGSSSEMNFATNEDILSLFE